MNSTATLLERHKVVTDEREVLVDQLADTHLEADLIATKALRLAAGESSRADREAARADRATRALAAIKNGQEPADPGGPADPDPGQPGTDVEGPPVADHEDIVELPAGLEQARWAYERHALLLPTPTNAIVVRVEREDGRAGISKALQRATEDLDAVAHPGRHDVVVLVAEDVVDLDGFGIGTGSKHAPTYVSPAVLEARSVSIVAAQEPTREMVFESRGGPGDRPLDRIHPSVKVAAKRARSGGDLVYIKDGRADFRINFIGVELQACGRAIIAQSSRLGAVVGLLSSHMSVDPIALAEGADMKWGLQSYSTTPIWQDVSFELSAITEHPFYGHGHAPGRDLVFSRVLGLGNGGQTLQLTERRHETVNRPDDRVLIDDCYFTGFHTFPGRAGSALTFAGAGLRVTVTDSAWVDDNPDDTATLDPQYVGKNFGGYTVWSPLAETQSYAETPDQGGRANATFVVIGSMFAIRNGGRSIGKIHDVHAAILEDTAHLAAPAQSGGPIPGQMIPNTNGQLDRKRPCNVLDVRSSGPAVASPLVMSRLERHLGKVRASEYVRLPMNVHTDEGVVPVMTTGVDAEQSFELSGGPPMTAELAADARAIADRIRGAERGCAELLEIATSVAAVA